MDEQPPKITLLQRREIEARIVAPIIAAVREELGEERTLALLERVVGQLARDSGAELARSCGEAGLPGFATSLDRWTEGGALELRVIEQSDDRLDFDVTRCRYAEMYHRLGLGELGSRLSCCRDAALAAGYDPRIELSRTQTIMRGAPSCDFRFRRRPAAGPAEPGDRAASPSGHTPCNPEGGAER
ncbi:L-2-amino-thiazoline-4-carboxylic acid hydrolase [Tautonia plasticadhaerens]|uniref:L-2-amino-thiazoline-4-carboxylic acid hydrolase n=1 Tax=Tautonia plasticadhaerens TaxID=2527974 RepID=A0A518H517_9BACT|nr:L-2-amino-thiazoline-4-carboxylic acid hydrolase [Tautonia plasticadhaerens]QDV35932.1 hypothetical protein ElP_38410 [Tautonia plasticadhaerens]